MHGHSWNM